MTPPDAPRSGGAADRGAQRLMAVALVIATIVLVWFAVMTAWPVVHDAPIVTPSTPKTLVIAPSPDAAVATTLARIAADTASLPTITAAYVIEQTKTSGANVATWAALQQETDATKTAAPTGPSCLGCLRGMH